MATIPSLCLLAFLVFVFLGRFCSGREAYGDFVGSAIAGLNRNLSFKGRRGSPMVLPLVLSTFNSSRRFARRLRMHEGDVDGSVNAHMRLYDDLLTDGYYTTRLWIGTPPHEFALIVDSGSTVTYVPCSTCKHCGIHQDPRFQPDHSSTYQPMKCTVDCTCDKDQCTYERQYAEMSSSSGVLGKDVVSFGSESSLAPQFVNFGCENSETGDLHKQRADGIMGLGRGQLSIMDQLVEKGVISDSFSLCYGGMDIGGGAMVLGGIPPPHGMVFSPSNPARSPYYNIELREIHVAGEKLKLNPGVFNTKYGTVLDSGTTYAYLPEVAFIAFKDAPLESIQRLDHWLLLLPNPIPNCLTFRAHRWVEHLSLILKSLSSLRKIPGPDASYHDICFSGAGSDISRLSETFPKVEMVFSNSQSLSLSPENYLFKHSEVGAYCLGIFPNNRDTTTLLGGIIVRNTLVTYDRENETIGFWKTNCSELWERLQPNEAHSPATVPPLDHNKTIPAPGQVRNVAFIEFVLKLAIKLSDLIPHIPKLRQSIAHELKVELYQVLVVNFTSAGNNSVVAFAIYPPVSEDFIPNATVELVYSLLVERHMNLSSPFESYQLQGWEVHPSERTWLRRHLLAIIAMALMVGMLLASSLIGWYVWKRHSQTRLGVYKPVDAVIPEQELQPL